MSDNIVNFKPRLEPTMSSWGRHLLGKRGYGLSSEDCCHNCVFWDISNRSLTNIEIQKNAYYVSSCRFDKRDCDCKSTTDEFHFCMNFGPRSNKVTKGKDNINV